MSARPAPNSARKRKIKARLIERDGFACFYCGTGFATATDATVDHLVPQSQVPGWRLANLVLACQPCNQAKADLLPQALLRPVGFGPGLVPLSGALHSGAHLALAVAA
jgi:5-methylcytosine-specific restriction endonuclease McrA